MSRSSVRLLQDQRRSPYNHTGRMPAMDNVQAAEVSLPSQDLAADLAFYTRELGFRLDTIFPADDPAVAVLSGHGLRLRLERGAAVAPGVLRLLCADPGAFAGGRR